MPRVKVVLLDSDPESGSDLDAYYTASSQESFSGDEEFFALVRALSISEDREAAPSIGLFSVKVVLLDSDPESGSDLDAYYTASSQESFSGDEEFFALVRALSISEDREAAPSIDSAPPAPPVPISAPQSSASTSVGGDSAADVTLYSMSQNGQTRLTPHWSEAAASQGSAEVHALRRRRKDRKVTKPIIVVFVGLEPGVYPNWKAAKSHCRNVSCCIYQGYVSRSAATAAFQYATDHRWVLTVPPDDSALFLETRRQLLSTSALPLPGLFASNALNEGVDRDAWFCVYVGVSRAFTALNWNSLGTARKKFDIAMQANRVAVKLS
ncbi:hypothetical protein BDZ89DRAFT_1145960 [Hymenopellis radicata]|nr:hypothetical protein BDZ89DRAFT_1145960 [Hymenopellis radicata]